MRRSVDHLTRSCGESLIRIYVFTYFALRAQLLGTQIRIYGYTDCLCTDAKSQFKSLFSDVEKLFDTRGLDGGAHCKTSCDIGSRR